MNSLLVEVIVWLVGLCLLLMVVLEGYALLKWIIGTLIMSAQWLIRASWQYVVHFLIWLFGQLRKGGLKVSGLCKSWWPPVYLASMTYMKLFWNYLIKGRMDFDSFEDFKNDWNEFKQDQDSGQSDANDFQSATGSYAQALEILGLADQPDFTLADLKNQLRKMRAIVHPDKGFPNRVFIQQVNDAFATVKHERNWR